MINRKRFFSFLILLFFVLMVGILESVPEGVVKSVTDGQYKDHGWAKLDVLTNQTAFPTLFYSSPRGLITMLPDGCVVRINSLKTGFGNLYRAAQKDEEVLPEETTTVAESDKPEVAAKGKATVKDTKGKKGKKGKKGVAVKESIKAVQLGAGNVSQAPATVTPKQGGKVWKLYADTRDVQDPATKFMVSVVGGKYIALVSEMAGGLLVGSDSKTLDVVLATDKATDNELWELVEDPKAGDTLETCYLKNKATGGLLTASYDSSEGVDAAEIANLKNQIDDLEKKFPYLSISYARSSGTFNAFTTLGSKDLKAKLQEKVVGNFLSIPSKDWVTQLSGKTAFAAGWAAGRKVKIVYREGNAKEEKEITVKEGKPLKIEADISKHPATPLKKRLENLEKKNVGMKKLATSDVARTGYNGTTFPMSQWSKVAIETVAALGTDDDQGAEKDTIAGGSARNLYIWAHRNPEFKGFGLDKIDGFGPEMVVTINPLLSQGFAWLEQSLPVPGKGTILFRAIADKGDVQVCFSDAVAPRTVYRIAFGAMENNKTIIYKNDISSQEIDNLQNSNARIAPGMIEQFWVSINNGFIIVGKGDPGTNIIMAWQDPKLAANIERIGFSTFKSVVKYADVQKLADPIIVVSPANNYAEDKSAIQVGTIASPAWHKLPLSPADAGTLAFEAKGTEDATLVLANDKNEGYAISFGIDGNKATKIARLDGGKDLYNIDVANLPIAGLSPNKNTKFWVSLYKGQIILGNGEVGKNPFCIFVDPKTPKGISKIGFAGKSTIQNFEIWPEAELGFDQEASEYTKTRQFSAFKGALNIISPYNYRIIQEGPQVRFSDRLTGMMWNVGATPEPDAEYHYKLAIQPTGEPQLELLFKDPSAEMVKIEKAVKMLDTGAESAFKAGQTMAYATGPEIISNMVALAASASFSLVGTALKQAKASKESQLEELQQLAGRYVSTERVQRGAGGTASISAEAQRNRSILESKLEGILQLQLQDAAQLDYATKQWDDAFRLVTDFYVVEDKAGKRKLTDGLQEVYNAVKSLELTTASLSLFNRMINILIKAYNSPYLVEVGNAEDEQRRKDWYVWINELSTRLLGSPALMQIGINVDFKGEYLWMPDELPMAGSGSITFEAKAYNNVLIGLSENPYQVRNRAKRMYEIIIGMWDNRSTEIHRKSLGDAVVVFDHKQYPDLSPDPAKFKKYWINLDKGIISLGVGELGQNKICEWKDPYPFAPVKYVGLSNWLADVTFRNVKVGYALGAAQPVSATADVTPDVVPEPEPDVVEAPVQQVKKVAVAKPVVKAKLPVKTAPKTPAPKSSATRKTTVSKISVS